MTHEEKIEICRNILSDNGNKFCHVDFIKKDGTVRRMTLHKSKKLEATVTGMHPLITAKANETLKANGMMRVEELTRGADGKPIHQWRTLNLGSITRLAVNGAVLDFSKDSFSVVPN